MSITVLVADDHPLIRDSLKMRLEAQPDLEVVGAVGDGHAAVEQATRLRPDVVVLDISMPGLDGIGAARLIHAACPETRMIMLSMHGNAEHVYRALEAGATGYLLKDSAGGEVAVAVRAVHAGRRYLSDSIGELVAAGSLGKGPVRGPLQSLSKRELSVLQLIADGNSNADAARLLNISVKTVETYRGRMMQKLGLKSVADLVKFAIRHDLTQLR